MWSGTLRSGVEIGTSWARSKSNLVTLARPIFALDKENISGIPTIAVWLDGTAQEGDVPFYCIGLLMGLGCLGTGSKFQRR